MNLKTNERSSLPGSEGFWEPQWSPDGRFITAITGDFKKLILYDVHSRTWSELATMQNVSNEFWSHDGKYVYFDSTDVPEPAIYRFELSTHKLTQVISLKDFRSANLVYPMMALAPDDSLIKLRDTGIDEIYSLDLAVK